MTSRSSSAPGAEHFLTTHWSVVLTARDLEPDRAQAALGRLCQTYWYPLYAFVRRRGYSPHDAQDLTQEFFVRLLARDFLASVGKDKGKFRSFLLAAMKHFLANEWDRARAAKRGGKHEFLSLDAADAESRYGLEPPDTRSADQLYERRWAILLLDSIMKRLRAEHEQAGKLELYETLKGTLAGGRGTASYAQLGARLGLSEGAIKVAVHRLRGRYRELLREEIAQTVSAPAEIDAEIRHLFRVLAGAL